MTFLGCAVPVSSADSTLYCIFFQHCVTLRLETLIRAFEEHNSGVVVVQEKIIEQFQKCHIEHPIAKFFGECTDLKIKLDRCFREEKALKRKANFEESKKLKEQLRALRKENATSSGQ
ncbi:hypothetical protein GmHk_11G033062 [Glycine max]|nr:hypothetical protein GmHk_11G033062 [Glycine max]